MSSHQLPKVIGWVVSGRYKGTKDTKHETGHQGLPKNKVREFCFMSDFAELFLWISYVDFALYISLWNLNLYDLYHLYKHNWTLGGQKKKQQRLDSQNRWKKAGKESCCAARRRRPPRCIKRSQQYQNLKTNNQQRIPRSNEMDWMRLKHHQWKDPYETSQTGKRRHWNLVKLIFKPRWFNSTQQFKLLSKGQFIQGGGPTTRSKTEDPYNVYTESLWLPRAKPEL